MQIWCDESGGVGRGLMTLAAVAMDADTADAMIARFRADCAIAGEVKGSRIDLKQRSHFLDLFIAAKARAVVGIATRVLIPDQDTDRGNHDLAIYTKLLDDSVAELLLESGGCAQVVIDDGRYAPPVLADVRQEVAALIGPCGSARLEDSHRASGLQIADVIANSFFNRAIPNQRQSRFAAQLAPLLESGQIRMKVLID